MQTLFRSLLVIGAVMLPWGIAYLVKWRRQNLRYTARATATVLEVNPKMGVSIQFKVDDVLRECEVSMPGRVACYANSHTVLQKGQRLEVLYDPASPLECRLAIDRMQYANGWLGVIIGAVSFLAAFVVWLM